MSDNAENEKPVEKRICFCELCVPIFVPLLGPNAGRTEKADADGQEKKPEKATASLMEAALVELAIA